MHSNRFQAALELEIQSLLILYASAPAAVTSLLQKYETQKLSFMQLESISIFCLHVGLPVELLDFLCKQLKNESVIPWAHFAEALALSQERIEPEVMSAILLGAREQKLSGHLSRSHVLDNLDSQIAVERDMRRRGQQEQIQQLKRELLIQIDMYRSQELETEEGQVLRRLMGMFPLDEQIQNHFVEHRSRKALRLLDSKIALPIERNWQEAEARLDAVDEKDLGVINTCMVKLWEDSGRDPEMGVDFAVANMMWENPDGALPFLPENSDHVSAAWLRAEAQLRTRRFIELLAELVNNEMRWTNDPEATFAISYLRAQALWGLAKKIEAIEILEGIVNVRPTYRSAAALLVVWRGRNG